MHVRNLAERVTRDAEANGRSGDGDAAAVLSARGRRDEFVKNEAGSGSESMTLDMTRRMCSLQHVFSIECVLYSNEYDIGHSAQNQMQRPESKIVERLEGRSSVSTSIGRAVAKFAEGISLCRVAEGLQIPVQCRQPQSYRPLREKRRDEQHDMHRNSVLG